MSRKIGIEFEFGSRISDDQIKGLFQEKGVSLYDNNGWKLKYDGSVRISSSEVREKLNLDVSYPYGREISSPILDSDDLESVKKVCKILQSTKDGIPLFFINATCGLHIHIDWRETPEEKKESEWNTVKTLEPELTDLLPPYRRATLGTWANSVRGIPINTANARFYFINKNDNLNTLEHRYLTMTLRYKTIESWVKLLVKMHEYGATHEVPYIGRLNLADVLNDSNLANFVSSRKEKVSQLFSPRIFGEDGPDSDRTISIPCLTT